MQLSPGDKLGPYEILACIGAGGMGQVYKARDTRIERTVAIKVSAAEFSERFQREAHAIGSLNHQHICTLHDVGPDYLVMEYIEGTPLKGPLPLREALSLAVQIADAVNHAHRNGVIHRDLKPSNILVTKAGVKVLDFGLAKFGPAAAKAGSQTATSLAATMTHALTQEGTIVGTPQYMAPEQVEGQEADARADIFAFGAVLYEMITGRMAFTGKTQANVIASVLAAEPPPVTNFQPLIPPALDHLIKTCLAKDPAERRQSMQDVLLELKWITESGSQAGTPAPVIVHRKRRERAWCLIAGMATAAAIGLAVLHFNEKPAERYAARFEQQLPPKVSVQYFDMPVISPDGRMLAMTGATTIGGKNQLWLRHLDSPHFVALPGTDEASRAFWSPDSRFIAYVAGGKLLKVDAAGGPPQFVANLLPASAGASWNHDGVILVGRWNGPIYRVSASGSEPQPLLKLDESRHEAGQFMPQFLPDGHRFLYSSYGSQAGQGGIYISSIDKTESRRISNMESNAVFVPSGHLLFGRGATLLAQRFDLRKFEVTGEPQVVADPVGRSGLVPLSYFSASANGALLYRSDVSSDSQLVWCDRTGRRVQTIGQPRSHKQGTLSPDEKRFAVEITDTSGNDDIWLLELSTGILSRVTSDPHSEDTPIWSPDGRELVFCSNRSGRHILYRKVVGGGDEQPMLSGTESNYPAEYLKDGSLLFMNTNGKSFYLLPPGPDAKPVTLLKTEYSKDEPRVSPDGRWVAYNTNESGRWEVYLARFPEFTERRQVSSNGGVQGYWRKDGKELFYLALDGTMMSVAVKLAPSPETGIPQTLFPTRIRVSPTSDQFAVKGDGQQFLLMESTETEVKPLTVVLNWQALLKN